MPEPRTADLLLRDATRVLCVGIGGGGDVVGALAVRAQAREPADLLHPAAALAGPATSGPGGFLFGESRVAALLGEPTLLLDPHGGPRGVASALDRAAELLGCDLVVLFDVGGDVLAHGDEAGLGSPLADAVCLASAAYLATPNVGAVLGAGCDGELRPDEVAARVEEVRAAGGVLDVDDLGELRAAAGEVVTEASPMALRCARLVVDAEDLDDADRRLGAAGITTELAWERAQEG